MKQLTVRGFDRELERRIQALARHEGVSLNRAALLLLRRGAGLGEPKRVEQVVGSTLDHLIGTWSAEEESEFLESLRAFEQVDESLWR